MAKGKYEYWLAEEGLMLLEGWARDGLTDEQIADKIGISRKTLYEWCKKYGDICNTLKRGKEVVDRQVENALLKKALGYNAKIQKAFKIKEVLYEDGKRLKEIERIEYAEDEVHIPADTTAQIFWLKNRKPNVWRDKQETTIPNETFNEGMQTLADLINNPVPNRNISDFEGDEDA